MMYIIVMADGKVANIVIENENIEKYTKIQLWERPNLTHFVQMLHLNRIVLSVQDENMQQ